MCGLPASGKTTISRNVATILENKHGIPTMVISSDDFRRMVSYSSSGFQPEKEATVKLLFERTISTALENAFLVICDDMNYYKSMRADLSRIAKKSNSDYDIVFVDTPVDVAIKWNQARGGTIPDSLIEEINQKLDPPKGDYKWDTAMVIVDPSKQSSDEIANLIVSGIIKRLENPIRSKPKKIVEDEKSLRARSIERETRKSMMEVMTRFKNPDLAISLSKIRKEVVKKALMEGVQPTVAVEMFLRDADEVTKNFTMPEAKGLISVHVGLFGHVDHGKTMLARRLTEKPSTAALDKAPDSARRGMTLDMGFSAFWLDNYMVTLVDLPGHFSLIKHAVAGANIIDSAILVVAADLGLQIQSVEHFSIIKNLGIKDLVVALNKIDAASPERIEEVKKKIALMLKGTRYENAKIVGVSGLTGAGIEELKNEIKMTLKPPVRQWVGPFKMPIDHAFIIAGVGTVLTGTIHRGKVKLKDTVEIKPIDKIGQVRSLRSFGEEKDEAIAGDRVGIAVKDIKPDDAHRGFIACTPGSLKSTNRMIVEFEMDRYYRRSMEPKSGVTAFIGSYEILANATPGTLENSKFIVKPSIRDGEKCMIYLELKEPVVAESGDRVLLLNSGLQAREFRIIGGGRVTETENIPELYSRKVKSGTVKEKQVDNNYIISGLASDEGAALKYTKKQITTAAGIKGEIIAPSKSSGEVVATFSQPIQVGEKVFLVKYKKLQI